jgi:bis(5'-nucleosyl)-tetraphosphatase (symmetrical)
MDYAIGDVHGCYSSLMSLLDKLNFNDRTDRLWFTGDFVNRGADALSVLRFISSLSCKPNVVLGNHDLHFLAVYFGAQQAHPRFDLFDDLLNATDIEALVLWLLKQKLAIYEPTLNFLMTHAGICPDWTLPQTLSYAKEIELALSQPLSRFNYFEQMYGNEPALWSDELSGGIRLRVLTNYLTRMRYLDKNSQQLLLAYKTLSTDEHVKPWFDFIKPDKLGVELIFGHWAALKGRVNRENIYGIDTGCYFGGPLTALCLQTKQLTHAL